MYNWEFDSWPVFQFDENLFASSEKLFLFRSGVIEGKFNHFDKEVAEQSLVDLLVNEAIKSTAIEGEMLSRIDLISSIKKNLGFATPAFHIRDKRAAGFAKLFVSSRENFDDPLTEELLFEWHKMLMEGAYLKKIGCWRSHSESMQIISGRIGNESVHFEAPPSEAVATEMVRFIDWFENSPIQNTLVKAAIAHLYFESIHPFEDGNGRIGRIIAEKALSIGIGKPVLFSISTSIEQHRNAYYAALKAAQQTLAINDWIEWFCNMVLDAQQQFDTLIGFSIKKAKFFDRNQLLMNDRQQKVIARMLEEGEIFEGGMTSKKYMSLTKTSKATATRDLQDLVEKGILNPANEGRSRNYQVKMS